MALAESASRFELAPSRESFSHIPEVLPLPNLIQTQTDSFHWFVQTGLRDLLDEITPITDFTGKNLELHFRDYYFEEPKFSEDEETPVWGTPTSPVASFVARSSGRSAISRFWKSALLRNQPIGTGLTRRT